MSKRRNTRAGGMRMSPAGIGARRLRAGFAAAVLASTARPAAANIVIVQDTFDRPGWSENIEGAAPDTANLPGGRWVSAVQWEWSHPFIRGAEQSHWAQNAVDMGEEKASINISLAGYNSGRLRIAADIAIPADEWLNREGVGLGFKATVPRPATGYTNIDYDAEIKTDFTGLRVNGAGVMTLIVNGVAQSTVEIEEMESGRFYPLVYDIDTAGGDISNIRFNGRYISDFATSAFRANAVSNATFLVFAASRGCVDNFAVTAIEGVLPPVIDNAEGATDIVCVLGTATGAATLNGTLTAGNEADIFVFWGTDAGNWAHTSHLGRLPEGRFSLDVSGLELSTTYHYRCQATNTAGSAWADGTASFLSAAQAFLWTGAGDGTEWGNAANWNPATRFPALARETACFRDGAQTVLLGRRTVTLGGISFSPAHWLAGYDIAAGDPEGKLVFDYEDGPAFIRQLDNRWANSTISAPVVLNNDLEVTTVVPNPAHALIFRGPISGAGRIVARNARIALDPAEETVYDISFVGTKNSGFLEKRGTGTAVLRGTCSIALGGGWDDHSAAVMGGGRLVLAGGIFTNQTATTRGTLFRGDNNALVITNGAQLINARGGNHAYYTSSANEVVIAGPGSLWDLHGDWLVMNGAGNRLTIIDGGRLGNATGRIGWEGGSCNTVRVAGASSLWNVGGTLAVGRNTASNTLLIADGGRVENTWLWLGGYDYYADGGGTGNGLVVAGGGVLDTARDEGWGWGSCVGVSGVEGGRVDDNHALVTGEGSTWTLGGRPLRIGYVTKAGATGVCNRVRVEAGGAITNVGTLHVGCVANNGCSASNRLVLAAGGDVSAAAVEVGQPASAGNMIELRGGTLRSGSLTLDAGSGLAPAIGRDAPEPVKVAGTATFADGSLVSPREEGGRWGRYTILAAGAIADHGLRLDPAADPRHWRLDVDATTVTLFFRPASALIFLR
jgi:T5SS/PEP-CTERM-associated repeat protein